MIEIDKNDYLIKNKYLNEIKVMLLLDHKNIVKYKTCWLEEKNEFNDSLVINQEGSFFDSLLYTKSESLGSQFSM